MDHRLSAPTRPQPGLIRHTDDGEYRVTLISCDISLTAPGRLVRAIAEHDAAKTHTRRMPTARAASVVPAKARSA